MGLFSKKSDVPELPRAPTLPKLSDSPTKPHMLPSIGGGRGRKMGDQMLKSAVTDTDSPMHPPMHSTPMMHELPSDSSEDGHKKEVFVKLDKFTQAQKTFEKMKVKMSEIESLVNKAKQLNEREKAELDSWHEELDRIRSKVTEIDSEVFNQV
ncbi:hypothetical protein CMI41_02010 [Candidatus Pacearchaeota archaeon]|nr:hypothetical protein [Candidatus Pacearchaeota archaeon]|tara:strand:+ start:14201 stop:14659 length:459 start_codon:yes stop_codon:yes gene_type:complete